MVLLSCENAGFSLASDFSTVVSGRLCSSLAKSSGPLQRPFTSTATISASNFRRLRREALLRTRRPTVLITADLVLRDEGPSVPNECSPEKTLSPSLAEHEIVNLGIAHPIAPATAGHEVGGGIHVLHAASDSGVSET